MKSPALFRLKLEPLRECQDPRWHEANEPDTLAAYYQANIATDPQCNPLVETFWVIGLNTRFRILGHVLVSHGTADTILVDPPSVFRPALLMAARCIVVAHNHPSGNPEPSEADVRVTRDLMRAGTLLRIEVKDHLVMAHPNDLQLAQPWVSLREAGHFSY